MDAKKLQMAKQIIGNTFALSVLLQKRCQELVRGAQKLVDLESDSPIDIALEEVVQGKILLGSDEEPKIVLPEDEDKLIA
jgi:DNA-directed RNA polymerase subunit omega